MSQVHKQKGKQDEPEIDDIETPEKEEFNIDDILDEIDDVLEENAEEFVRSYIQKGGE
jgi:prokaryotic ubiquitin-like protein Pup